MVTVFSGATRVLLKIMSEEALLESIFLRYATVPYAICEASQKTWSSYFVVSLGVNPVNLGILSLRPCPFL